MALGASKSGLAMPAILPNPAVAWDTENPAAINLAGKTTAISADIKLPKRRITVMGMEGSRISLSACPISALAKHYEQQRRHKNIDTVNASAMP